MKEKETNQNISGVLGVGNESFKYAGELERSYNNASKMRPDSSGVKTNPSAVGAAAMKPFSSEKK